jgi:hypothetical protein
VQTHITDYTRRHFRRLLLSGHGTFWTLDGRGRAWLTGSVELTRRLVALAGPGVIGTINPARVICGFPSGKTSNSFGRIVWRPGTNTGKARPSAGRDSPNCGGVLMTHSGRGSD